MGFAGRFKHSHWNAGPRQSQCRHQANRPRANNKNPVTVMEIKICHIIITMYL